MNEDLQAKTQAEIKQSEIPANLLTPEEAPKALIDTMAQGGGSESDKGLILSEDNLIDIYTYIQYANYLPTEPERIKRIMPFEKVYPNKPDFDKITDKAKKREELEKYPLSQEYYKDLFLTMKNHAKKWIGANGFESEIPQLGTDLKIFANKYCNYIDTVILLMQSMPLMLTQQASNCSVTLTKEDREYTVAVSELIQSTKEESIIRQQKVKSLYDRLVEYYDELNAIEPRIMGIKRELVLEDKTGDINERNKRLEENRGQIEKLQKEYDKYCGLACTGLAGIVGGPLVLLTVGVTGGLYGSKAENARKQRNNLLNEIYELEKELAADKKMQKNIKATHSSVDKMLSCLGKAITGLQLINGLWLAVGKYLDSIINEVSNLTDSSRMTQILASLKTTKATWGNIEDTTALLVSLFTSAKEKVMKQQLLENNPWN